MPEDEKRQRPSHSPGSQAWEDAKNRQWILQSGHIGDFDLFIAESGIIVMGGGKVLLRHRVNLSQFLAKNPKGLRLGLGWTEDFTIFQLKDPEGFGYALNLEAPDLSEWGYCE